MGYLTYLFLACMPIIFYVFVLICLNKTGTLLVIRKISLRQWSIIFLISLIQIYIVYIIVDKNEYIYFWDYGREWTSTISLIKNMEVSLESALQNVYYTINNSDYNQLMQLLIAFPLSLLQGTFTQYVVIHDILYMCPAFFLTAIYIYRFLEKSGNNTLNIQCIFLGVSMVPIIYYVMLDGFMDAPVLILVTCILLLTLDIEYDKVDVGRCVLLSIALTLLVLFRRHFAYFAVGFLISQIIILLYQCIEAKMFWQKYMYGYIKSMALIGIPAFCCLLIFFSGFLKQSIFNHFTIQYSAYDVSLREKIYRIVEVFGIPFLIVALIGTVCGTVNKKIKVLVISHCINILITTGLLWRVLQMNYHQTYLIVILLLTLEAIGILYIYNFLKCKKIYIIAVAVYSMLNIVVVFNSQSFLNQGQIFFSSLNYEPKIRNDIEVIHKIVEKLKKLTEKGGEKIYILASSEILNSSILTLANMPEETNAIPTVISTHDVDLRDGFPSGFLEANYVLVGDPVQLHLPNGTQEVVSYLAKEILDENSFLGKHFEEIARYQLDNCVDAIIYKKISPFTREDYEQLQKYYDQKYGDFPELFHERLVYPKPFFPYKEGDKVTISWDQKILNSMFSECNEGLVSQSDGWLVYGPYKKIEAGKYSVVFKFSYKGRLPEGIELGRIEVCTDEGEHILASKTFAVGDNEVSMECVVPKDSETAEVRMYVLDKGVKFEEVIVENIGCVAR